VRATNIFRKGGYDLEDFANDAANQISPTEFAKHFSGGGGNEIWELWLAASKTAYIIDQCIATAEPAYLAKHAFRLGQLFNNFYHRYPILTEADQVRKKFLLLTAAVLRRELTRVLSVMGISVPSVM
jgi:arginyl-tRNA synthetase